MSYWIFRDLEGNALGIEDEEPEERIIEAPNGVWIGEIRETVDGYTYYEITRTKNPNTSEYSSASQLMGTIHPITKDQFETYQEFGLFSDE